MMEKNVRKKYEKPRLTIINLDAKCAVLGFCKLSGAGGPGRPGVPFHCATVPACSGLGS